MTKRGIFLGIILVIGLLSACVYSFLWMKRQLAPVPSSALFCVIPPDALVVQRFKSFEGLCGTYASGESVLARFCPAENGLSHLLKKVSNGENETFVFSKLFRAESVLSVHNTGKNNVQVLLGVNFKNFTEGEDAFEKIRQALGGATLYKRYNKVDVYQLFEPSSLLYMAVSDGFLLAGTSFVVVESAIRHLVSGRSLMDNGDFAALVSLASVTAESSVYGNVQQFDKLFGALFGKRMQPYADFTSKSASWMALDGNTAGLLVQMSGYLHVDKGDANFFAALGNQAPAQVKIWEAVPAATLAFVSFSCSDFSAFLRQYGDYLEIHKKDKQATARTKAWEAKTGSALGAWFAALAPAEVALAWVPVQGGYQWVTLVRSSHIQQARKHLGFTATDAKQPPLLPNQAAGAFSALFGSFFAKSADSHYTVLDNILYFGSNEALESMTSGRNKAPSLYSLMKQGRARGAWKEEAGLTCILQAAADRDSLLTMCHPLLLPTVKEAILPYRDVWTVFQVSSVGGKPYAHLLFFADSQKPAAGSSKTPSKDAVDKESIPMVVGKFRIFNHATRKYEELEQKEDSTLVLNDASKKQTWRTRRKYAIVDQVAQIDYYKNDKLQMLFASEGKELCLLDILGRLVAPYPKEVEVPVRKGPFVFDRGANKEYEIFIIHTDNSLRLYDYQTGTAAPGWRPFIPEDRIEQKPVLLSAAATHYWLVYGALKDYILNADGTVAVALQKRDRIQQDAKLEVDADGVLKGTTIDGQILTVQLNTGTIKTRKP